MKYTTLELCEILNVTQNTIWSWINNGVVSCHSNHKGEVIKLKAEIVNGKGQGGKLYIIDSTDLDIFLRILYKNSYFYNWWRK